MRILTKRLILREINLKDARSIAQNANDYDVWYFTEQVPHPYTIKDAKWFINKCKKQFKEKPQQNYDFGIELKSEKKIIGLIGLNKVNRQHKKASIGYWLGKEYRKKGITSEAEKAILNFALQNLKLNKVSGDALIKNKGSVRLFKKFGFIKVGILKEELIKKGKKLDAYRFELLKKNYKPSKI